MAEVEVVGRCRSWSRSKDGRDVVKRQSQTGKLRDLEFRNDEGETTAGCCSLAYIRVKSKESGAYGSPEGRCG